MILFKAYHIKPIYQLVKTQTRRVGAKRWNVGAIHQCQTRLFDRMSVFAKVLITDVYKERLGDISEKDAYSEGGYTVNDYIEAWKSINGNYDPDIVVWVVKFQLREIINASDHLSEEDLSECFIDWLEEVTE